LIAHITAGGGALVLGPLQFWGRFRARYMRLHRWVGIAYLLAILVSSVCALILSFTTAYKVNWAYAFSLQVWVSVWIISTIIAYWAALQKKFKLHREWMTRSYIVTLAFIVSGLALKYLLYWLRNLRKHFSLPVLDGLVRAVVCVPGVVGGEGGEQVIRLLSERLSIIYFGFSRCLSCFYT
jgi:uncharacterized membrane protein